MSVVSKMSGKLHPRIMSSTYTNYINAGQSPTSRPRTLHATREATSLPNCPFLYFLETRCTFDRGQFHYTVTGELMRRNRKLKWDQWGSSHSGPVMNYLADCGGNCSTFKGDTGTPWVKFDQMAYDTTKSPPWGSDFLAKQGAAWTVTLPNLKPGEYLLRHEILGLHVAGTRMGAQFYPACVQIKVGGSGTKSLPAGVGLPGAYNPDDTNGVLVQLWRVNQGQVTYTAPGGPVITI
jgi:hypothetical protein